MARHLLGLVTLSLVLTACGSGRTSKPPLSAAAFRAQANRVCDRAHTHAQRLAGLRKLHRPAADADLYARWLEAEREAVTASRPPKDKTAKPLFDARTPLTIAEGKIDGYARRLGATRCRRLPQQGA